MHNRERLPLQWLIAADLLVLEALSWYRLLDFLTCGTQMFLSAHSPCACAITTESKETTHPPLSFVVSLHLHFG